jgi:hypothetical protein
LMPPTPGAHGIVRPVRRAKGRAAENADFHALAENTHALLDAAGSRR